MDPSLQKQQQTAPDLYAAPDAELAPQGSTQLAYGQAPLADRGTRLGAFLLDGLIWAGLFVVAFFVAGMLSAVLGDAALAFAALPLFGLLGYNLYLLVDNAQTLGKKIMGIKIVRGDLSTQASIWRIIFLRYLPVNIVSNIPCIGLLLYLANFLLIFRHDKKCGHDHIADTHVVEDRPAMSVHEPAYGQPAPTQDFEAPLASPADDGRWEVPTGSSPSSGDDDLDSSWGDDFDDPWGDDDSSGPKW